MGSSTSKAAKGASRSFPKSPLPSSGSVNFPPPPISFPSPSSRPTPPPPPSSNPSSRSQNPPTNPNSSSSSSTQHGASESKTEEIQRDGSDPTLLSHLSKIGQVEIPINRAYEAPPADSSPYTPLFHSRATDRISFPTVNGLDPIPTPDQLQNRLTSSELVDLLYRRHHARSGPEVQALAQQFHIDVQVLEQDLGRFLCVVRPEWGLEVLDSAGDVNQSKTLNQQTNVDAVTKLDHVKTRALTRKSAERGSNDLRLGSEAGRANSGKIAEDGSLVQDSDASRVLARWRDPILPLGISQTLRDQLEQLRIESQERENEEKERRAVEKRARDEWEKQEKAKRAVKMRQRIGNADI